MKHDANSILREQGAAVLRTIADAARPLQAASSSPDDRGAALPSLSLPPITMDEWRHRDLPEPDLLLGSWLSTTTRALISAPTGIGKSNFAIALGQHIAGGLDFLHWQARRPARVLYIDGEMARRLLKQRILDEEKRHGGDTSLFFPLSHEDVPNFRPLNTLEGQQWILALVEKIKPELVVFDNVMSLTLGDQTNELVWQQTMPLVIKLTKLAIGQIWIHHTGHDETKGYGTKTREWSLDTVGHFEEVKREDTDVSFKLVFRKARERTPATRHDFQDVKIALVHDRWEHEATAAPRAEKIRPATQKALDALINVLAGDDVTMLPGNRRAAHRDQWAIECNARGLIDLKGKSDSARSLMNTFRRELVTANRIACEGDLQWLR